MHTPLPLPRLYLTTLLYLSLLKLPLILPFQYLECNARKKTHYHSSSHQTLAKKLRFYYHYSESYKAWTLFESTKIYVSTRWFKTSAKRCKNKIQRDAQAKRISPKH
jgi:hypothetical protein